MLMRHHRAQQQAEPGAEGCHGPPLYSADSALATITSAAGDSRDPARTAARHLAQAVHFVSDTPDPDLIKHVAGHGQRRQRSCWR
jgi:hypothetical protein